MRKLKDRLAEAVPSPSTLPAPPPEATPAPAMGNTPVAPPRPGSTRERLEKLVQSQLKNRPTVPPSSPRIERPPAAPLPDFPPARGEPSLLRPAKRGRGEPFVVHDFVYDLDARYGSVCLRQWREVSPSLLASLAGDDRFAAMTPDRLVFFDTETTGLSGGTGTIPFMLGFGFLDGDVFAAKIFTLKELDREEEMLTAVGEFLAARDFAATVTYNGRAFDFPLMESRAILTRCPFPLLARPHLDFLFPARLIWRHTYESRRLGYLGERLLGLSRGDDIDGAEVPVLFNSYLRSGLFSLIEPVIEHNSLDLLGLSALLLLAVRYLDDYSRTRDEGEILGLGSIHERNGSEEQAAKLYQTVRESGGRTEVVARAVKRLALMAKRRKLFEQAQELWQDLAAAGDPGAYRELSIHLEHRQGRVTEALALVERGLGQRHLPVAVRTDLEKRLERLLRKAGKLEPDEGGDS